MENLAQLRRDFGERVRQIRSERGLTQVELSQRLGWHQPVLCDLEKGRHAATLDTVKKIANALGVPPADLVGNGNNH